jgi:hypothetical protein
MHVVRYDEAFLSRQQDATGHRAHSADPITDLDLVQSITDLSDSPDQTAPVQGVPPSPGSLRGQNPVEVLDVDDRTLDLHKYRVGRHRWLLAFPSGDRYLI